MRRTRDIPGTLVVFVVAIFTMQTVQVVSSPVEVRQTARDEKSDRANAEKLLGDSDCRSCHAMDRKVVGPSYSEIAKRYAAQADATDKLTHSIRQGGSGNWGSVAMTPHPDLKDEQLSQIVTWILSLNDVGAAPAQEAKQYKYTLNDGKTVTLDFPVFIEGSDKKVAKDIFRGYQLYNSYCYRCHGTDATTSELAPDLRRFTESGSARQDFLSVAMAGREDKGMPSWAGFLSEEEVQQIYKYVKGRSLELVPSGRPPSEYD
jgi:cytochrome c